MSNKKIIKIIQELKNELQLIEKGDFVNQKQLLSARSKDLLNVCTEVGKSWSYSFVWYQGNMYFEWFKEPNTHDRFIEMNLVVNGQQRWWKEYSATDVKSYIEQQLLWSWKIDDFEKDFELLHSKIINIHDKIKVQCSVLRDLLPESERMLSEEIIHFSFGESLVSFLKKALPERVASSNRSAAQMWISKPVHIHYECLSQSIGSTIESIDEFIRLVKRFTEQIKLKWEIATLWSEKWTKNGFIYTNPIWILWKVISYLLKHKAISFLIAIIWLLTADYNKWWENYHYIVDNSKIEYEKLILKK